jgi:hypothetical protein
LVELGLLGVRSGLQLGDPDADVAAECRVELAADYLLPDYGRRDAAAKHRPPVGRINT